MELGAVTKGLNARKEQEAERNELNATIDESTDAIATLTQKKSELNADRIAIEAEVESNQVHLRTYLRREHEGST